MPCSFYDKELRWNKMIANSVKEKQKEITVPETEEKKKNSRKERKEQKERKQKVRVRKFPIWLRIIVIFLLCVLSLAVGLMVGYGVFGDGNPADVFNKDTWQHIIDIVKKQK